MTNIEVFIGSVALLVYIFGWIASISIARRKKFLSTKFYLLAMFLSPLTVILFLLVKDGSGNKEVNPIILINEILE